MTLEERFWSKVDIPLGFDGEPDGEKHWMWMACVDKDGYGIFWDDGKNIQAQRVAYLLRNGEFDKTKCVLHSCDIPGCCNPEHLWLGTKKDNRWDCLNKGRNNPACGDKNGARLHPETLPRGDKHYSRVNPEKLNPPSGEKHFNTKLTWKDIKEIRASSKSQKDLSTKYKVSQQNISNIKNKKTWKEK